MTYFLRATLLALTALLTACAGSQTTLPLASSAPSHAIANTSGATSLYAFSSVKTPQVASYTLPASGSATPAGVLEGVKTQLAFGAGSTSSNSNTGGIAVEGTTLYVLDGAHSELLSFPAGAHGNVAPRQVATLPRNGYYVGLALDGRGNFWTAEWNSLTIPRFSLHGRGSLKPSAKISPKLNTPNGLLKAAVTTVATRGSDLYCICVVLYRAAQSIGITEYAVDAKGHYKLVKSYYDDAKPGLPELPPSMMHVDATSGEIYAASPLSYTGVYAWPPYQKSGVAHRHRRIYGPSTGLEDIESLTTDSKGQLYVATSSGVQVFPPAANGDVEPQATIADPHHLQFTQGEFGDYITIF